VTKLFISLKRTFFLATLIWAVGVVHIVNAQTLDSQRMAAVMTVINMYLLAGREPPIDPPSGTQIAIDIDASYQVNSGQTSFAQFDLQEEGIEFCLDIAAGGALDDGDILVEVNGEAVEAVEGKDNCYQISEPRQRDINYVVITNNSGAPLTLTRLELAPSEQTHLTLARTTRGTWDERAVRKVIKIFAFGGHATDVQIQEWADMDALDAIQEMLTFDEHNLKLSPLAVGETYTGSATQHGTLTEWVGFLSSQASNLPIPLDERDQYSVNSSNFDDGFNRMITVRGLNPFRQRIGFWETNYHLATNLDASVSRAQMARYYDIIMEAHEANLPYHQVMGIAAKSAAVAEQYGHDRNQWRFDRDEGEYVCRCNEDFAREIHQLFYGIFGEGDPNHEDVTIPQTARMLTDMPILNDNNDPDDDLVVDFGTSRHYEGNNVEDGEGDATPLMILGQPILGADASEKIDNLMPISIEHPESLKNLPVMIISVLADDNLNESRRQQLRAAWASMGVGQKNLLEFIRAYAISNLFHSGQQFKYLTSHERALFIANKHNLDNLEAYFGGATYNGGRAGRSVGGVISRDNAGDFFEPLNNVFGGQTGLAAADSALVFENNYNALTDDEDDLRNAVGCNECDLGNPWEKKWSTVLPQRSDGNYYVEDIAPWLWNHVVGSMDNYTELERAHLYSLLGAARIDLDDDDDGAYPHDFNMVMCVIADYQVEESATDAPIIDILTHDGDGSWDNYCREFDDGGSYLPHEVAALNAELTGEDIANDSQIQDILNQLGQQTLRFNETNGTNSGTDVRRNALRRVNNALGFIFTTPFVFAEGQE